MQLDIALAQIADIRQQMQRTRQFRGLRSAGSLAMSFIALGAGLWQATHVSNFVTHPNQFLDLWIVVAFACMLVCTGEAVWRFRRLGSSLQQELTPVAVEQFLPFVVVGGVLTWVLRELAPAALWMLPGLWQLIFGLGLFSVRRIFPREIGYVAAFYLLCGFINLDAARPHFTPLCMALPFGLGQAAMAWILYWRLERGEDSPRRRLQRWRREGADV